MRYYSVKRTEQKSFKYRNKNKLNSKSLAFKLVFGTNGVITTQQFIFYYNYIKLIKLLLKNIKKKNRNVELFLFKLNPNFPVTKKSKNSRMGKGKGAFSFWIVKVKPYQIIFEYKYIPLTVMRRLMKKFDFFIATKLAIV